jgi:hypothetical protein
MRGQGTGPGLAITHSRHARRDPIAARVLLGRFCDALDESQGADAIGNLCEDTRMVKTRRLTPRVVLWVRDELASLRVHQPVEMFQRYLADDVRQCVGQLNDIEVSRASLDLQLHRREDGALLSAVGHCSRKHLGRVYYFLILGWVKGVEYDSTDSNPAPNSVSGSRSSPTRAATQRRSAQFAMTSNGADATCCCSSSSACAALEVLLASSRHVIYWP